MTTTRDEAYDKLMESVAAEYGPKALDLLKAVASICEEGGLAVSEPYDLSTDDYRWAMRAWRGLDRTQDEDSVDITVEIAEEREYEGGDGYGLNFGLDIVEWGGRLLGGCAPYNYTSLVWVDARYPGELADRWSLLENVDLHAIPGLILEDKP